MHGLPRSGTPVWHQSFVTPRRMKCFTSPVFGIWGPLDSNLSKQRKSEWFLHAGSHENRAAEALLQVHQACQEKHTEKSRISKMRVTTKRYFLTMIRLLVSTAEIGRLGFSANHFCERRKELSQLEARCTASPLQQHTRCAGGRVC